MGVRRALSSWAACISCVEWGGSLQPGPVPPAWVARRQQSTASSPRSSTSGVTHEQLEAEKKRDLWIIPLATFVKIKYWTKAAVWWFQDHFYDSLTTRDIDTVPPCGVVQNKITLVAWPAPSREEQLCLVSCLAPFPPFLASSENIFSSGLLGAPPPVSWLASYSQERGVAVWSAAVKQGMSSWEGAGQPTKVV